MLIGHVTDIHEDLEALATALDFFSAKEVNFVACTGDLLLEPYSIDGWKAYLETGSRLTFREHVFDRAKKIYGEFKGLFDSCTIPYAVIAGNYDTTNLEEVFGDRYIHQKILEFQGLRFGGFGGGSPQPSYNLRVIEMNAGLMPSRRVIQEFNQGYLYSFLIEHKPDVFLCHNPAKGILDCTLFGEHWGSDAFRSYIDRTCSLESTAVKTCLVGHVHESGPLGNNPRHAEGMYRQGYTVTSNAGNLGRFTFFEKETMQPEQGYEKGKIGWGTFAILMLDAQGKTTKVSQYILRGEDPKNVGNVQLYAEYAVNDP